MPDIAMYSMLGADASWGIIQILATLALFWDRPGQPRGEVRFTCLLWCLHKMCPFVLTLKDCIMGAARARLSDRAHNGSGDVPPFGVYMTTVEGGWAVSAETVQAALHWRYPIGHWAWYKVSHLRGAQWVYPDAPEVWNQNAYHALDFMFRGPVCGSDITQGDARGAWMGAAPGSRGVLLGLEHPPHWFCVTECGIWDTLWGDYAPPAGDPWGLPEAWDKVQLHYTSLLVGPFFLIALPTPVAVAATKGADMGAYAGLAMDRTSSLPCLNAFWDNHLTHATMAVKRRLTKDVTAAAP